MTESRPRKWLRRIGCSLAVFFVIEFFLVSVGNPDLVEIAFVYGYNGVQSVREITSDTVARFRQRTPDGPPPDVRVVSSANDFGFDLLRRLTAATPSQNVFFSPYSVSAATTLCANGASGATRTAVLKTLRLNAEDLSAANATQASLHEYLANTDWRIQVKTGNSLWADNTVDLRPEYVASMKSDLKADVESADLHSSEGMARLTGWISRNSNAQLASGTPIMGLDEHIALVNTITFHGKWKDQFKRAKTHPGKFSLEDGTTKTLPMMSRSGAVQTTGDRFGSEGGYYTAVNLPYGDGSMSMLIVLPEHDYEAHLSDLFPLLTTKQIDQWMGSMKTHSTGVVMPRFKVDCRPELDSALKMMGLDPAYEPATADFSNMGKGRNGLPISLNRTIHHAYLEVDEEGTRAGALTLHYKGVRGINRPVVVDRPFICLIRDNRTAMILFAGAIYDPQER